MKIYANPIKVGKGMSVCLKPGDYLDITSEKDVLANRMIEDFVRVKMNKGGTLTVLCYENGIVRKLKLNPKNNKPGEEF